MDRIKTLVREKLCKKGEAYRKRRMAAGEKSSAYLSGRAVKVCKGQMSGKSKKKKSNENLYKVKKGDTLYSISKKFNISLDDLMKLNNLDTKGLRIGQRIIVEDK